ncbi:hypothetical protein [Dyadobacter psychrotolerans]|uniref:TonB C-terminal domain-containing protein n=1 Tax=Dyadobacter psychrotolerans TaxID=2541721 RepID=A0A4R5D778_9BACT|nr:hypothetical protein [Dyadobacter psychrotolerans]TDE09362.1 hypothetical protein E0F88_30540 [Dyadobacter psychrotolerans]
MKILLFSVIMLFQSVWTRSVSTIKEDSSYQISKQLSSVLSYPISLYRDKDRVVVIQFYLNEGNTIARVKVLCENEDLRFDLIRQLTGRKLNLSAKYSFQEYTVRLHFPKDQNL